MLLYSSLFATLLNQSVTWSMKTGQDKYNEPTYTDSTIAARVEQKNRMARDETGEEVISNTTIFTQAQITAQDEVDGQKVIQVMNMVDDSGTVIGYEVLV